MQTKSVPQQCTLFLLLSLISFSVFSQSKHNFNYEANRKQLIDKSIAGLDSIKVDRWLFEFSCHDSTKLSVLFKMSAQTLDLELVSIKKYEGVLAHLQGMYITECNDISGKNYKSKAELTERVNQLLDVYEKTSVNLVGIGYLKDQATQKHSLPLLKKYIHGSIKSTTKENLEYAAVGIVNSEYGTITNHYGYFELSFPPSISEDAILTIQHVAYEKLEIPLKQFILNPNIVVTPKESVLEEILIFSKKEHLKKKVLGDKGKTNETGFVFGGKEGTEIAKRFDSKKKNVLINKVGVFISNRESKEFKLLIKIYEEDPQTGLPGRPLIKKQAVLESNLDRGWVYVDLNEQNIVTDQPFYIAFQWVSPDTSVPYIGMTGKKGLTRTSSLGQWKDSGQFRWMMNAEVIFLNKEEL
ncbi:carboxypeptidase-like regulatory domain-containing protein [Flammeovirga sp. EKP202]|uniref:carboxypeptidase-like regulatory domain-containing protein n=1 Tax=Flammeovirga sp. EKP202 TaxID=2770592 RepID=UPI00165FF37A|nr:carboxypeptidase-like regulatory domain-containing protein [Flammeovirga sp. EKP202]MBD0405021.1 carboxypeptidase-like regulatory domain-containing protein [Flammeovirga sp. EKP202]